MPHCASVRADGGIRLTPINSAARARFALCDATGGECAPIASCQNRAPFVDVHCPDKISPPRNAPIRESQRDPRTEATDLSGHGWHTAVCAVGHRQPCLPADFGDGHARDGDPLRRLSPCRVRSDVCPGGSGVPQPLRRALPHRATKRGSRRFRRRFAGVVDDALYPAPRSTACLASRHPGCLTQCPGGVSAAHDPALLSPSLIVQTIGR